MLEFNYTYIIKHCLVIFIFIFILFHYPKVYKYILFIFSKYEVIFIKIIILVKKKNMILIR